MTQLKPNKMLQGELALAALNSAKQSDRFGGYLLRPDKSTSNGLVVQFMLADIELYEKNWKYVEEKERRKEIARKCSEFFSKFPHDSRRARASESAARTRDFSSIFLLLGRTERLAAMAGTDRANLRDSAPRHD